MGVKVGVVVGGGRTTNEEESKKRKSKKSRKKEEKKEEQKKKQREGTEVIARRTVRPIVPPTGAAVPTVRPADRPRNRIRVFD